jgi:hypothetical protein
MDHVIKYDNLEEELGIIFNKLNIPFTNGLNIHEKAHYRTIRRDYRTYYDDTKKEIISHVFCNEINHFQ